MQVDIGEVTANGSYLAGVERMLVSSPVVTEVDFKTFLPGLYSMVAERLAVTKPEFVSSTWTTQTQSTYTMGRERVVVTHPEFIGSTWLQYYLIKYSNYIPERLAVTLPTVTATTWS